MNDHALAAALASETGERLLELRDELMERGDWGGWWPEEHGDATGHELLMKALQTARGDDGILSEEGHDDRRRLDHERVWIVDPLDGSSDYGRGSNEWAIHVALTAGGRGEAAAVALPALGVVFGTAMPPQVPERTADRPVVVTGRSRVRFDGVRVAEGLDADLMTCGSAGVKAMLVVTGQADVYVHAGPLYEWDVCAPAVVAEAAGLFVTDAFGQPLDFNKPRPVCPGFVVSRQEFGERVIDLID
ncbi:MAG: 3'(2'),5'-bisphosphate nucleotidase CysQ [Actinomycetota bacterium]